MRQKIDYNTIQKTLDWCYELAINGTQYLGSASEMADSYKNGTGSTTNKANRLIKWQITKASTSGFITGLGGIITLPVAIPANIASVLYVQIRMVAAIAHLGGYDIRDDRVKTLVYVCLTGNAAGNVFKGLGINFGQQMAKQSLKKLSGTVLTKINQRVGFRLLTKFGEKGLINLWKMIPLAGGVIGGTVDGISTKVIGRIARNTFIDSETI